MRTPRKSLLILGLSKSPSISDSCTRSDHSSPQHRIRNRHNERPIDILPRADPNADPSSDNEKIRSALRQAEAEASLALSDAVVDDDDEAEVDPDDVASDSD